jgi:spermidine synthase
MIARELLGTAQVPGGEELKLYSHGRDFMIVLERNELMSTRMRGSEESLATMTLQQLDGSQLPGRKAPRLLIGGYGMGFTLRAALAKLGPKAQVTVAELVPEIIEWARGPMHRLTAGALDDARVMLVMDDVAMLIDAAQDGYDAILLDVDNGPEGLTRPLNDHLYSRAGLQSAMTALKPRGILAIWSAAPDRPFVVELERAGFAVTEVEVDAVLDDDDLSHVIWFARKA